MTDRHDSAVGKRPGVALPQAPGARAARAPRAGIPSTRVGREELRRLAAAHVAAAKLVAPLTVAELRGHAEAVLRAAGLDAGYRDYTAVLVSNELWREAMARVPYARRLLLLPKCLRHAEKCPATFDALGLLCKQCGLCSLHELQEQAQRLGYAVLIAEGSAVVMQMIQAAKIEAIVGVSCLNVLERAFPYMESAAIPGLAVPLLQDDCADTSLDLDWAWDAIHLTSADQTRRLDLDALREEVESWFAPEALAATLGPAGSETERIAQAWLGQGGKRWRPFLAVCAYRALQPSMLTPLRSGESMAPAPGGGETGDLPESLRQVAVAVECFHKASLVHDDIEDDDELRYGQPTLHRAHGVPMAINLGDYLVGEGYRLLAQCAAPPEVRARLLGIAAQGHRTLTLGQGAELAWARRPEPLEAKQVLEIFRQKTAPAFEVALQLGAALAGATPDVTAVLHEYSEALGIAYQVRDDLSDWEGADEQVKAQTQSGAGGLDDIHALRPSLLLSLGYERARGEDRALLEGVWRRTVDVAAMNGQLTAKLAELDAPARAGGLLEAYKEQAIRSLRELGQESLKGLLRRVIGKIFHDLEIKGWCSEFAARHAAGGQVGPDTAG